MAERAFLEQLSKRLTDEGKLIEAGWVGLRLAAISPKASPEQLTEMRMSFFAGALHLWSSIMTVLEPGAEPTDKDRERMSLIHNEMERFLDDFKLK